LNSLSPELVDFLVYAQSTEKLWDELTKRYGKANGPSIYQLHRDMILLMQNDDPLTTYFNKMKNI